MSKKELSGTLKNLKFMQRATQREEQAKKPEEIVDAGDFPSSGVTKKCVVVMEGDPHPGAIKGRMSFLSFNPSIDKLNEEALNPSATCSGRQTEVTANGQNGSLSSEVNNPELDGSSMGSNGELKRKQVDELSEAQYPKKSPKSNSDWKSSSSNSKSSQKQSKRVDFNVLRPPKSQNRKR